MHSAEMAPKSAKTPRLLSWSGLAYYGETVGFLCAWVAGVTALAYWAGSTSPTQPPVNQMAVAEMTTSVER